MKQPTILLGNTLLSGLVAAFSPAWGQSPPAPAVTALDTIIVTGVAPSAPLTYVTDPKQPRQPLPASDATDYLTTIPGFSSIRNGGSNGDPVLRGMFGSRLNILTNGSTMPGACPSRMDAPSSYISPENFDSLTVIKGPQTVLWGPGASAGTVRFDRKAPGFTGPDLVFDGAVTGGSWGRNDQAIDLTAGNERLYGRVSYNHSHSQDYRDGRGDHVASRWDKWNGDITVGFTPDADTLFELGAGVGDGEARYAGRGMDGTKFARESASFRFSKENIGDVLAGVEVQAYYNYADHVMDNYKLRKFKPGGGMNMPMASNVDRRTRGGRVAATFTFGENVDLVTGVDYQDSDHRKRSAMGMGATYASKPWDKDANLRNTGVFGELTWRATDQSRLIGGIRLDRASAKDFRPSTGSGMMAMPNPTAGTRRKATLPGGFLRYEYDLASVPATLYAGVGHVQRFPDYWELFSPKTGPDGSVNAFDALRPEKTTQLDIGAQYKTDVLDAWISAYAGRIDDFILFDYKAGGMMGSMTQARNVNAHIAGGELGANYRLSSSWQIGGTLAYAWGKNRSDGRPMAQIPPLEANLNVRYEQGPWSTGAVWRLVAKQTRYAVNQGNVVSKDFGPSAGFGTLSLNGSYAFSKQVKLTVGIDNVFNKTYTEHLNLAGNAGFGYAADTAINEPGRTGWARLSLQF